MSEISTSQATPLLLTSQCTVSNENKDKSTTSSARRPRNREVRSRYKSNITQVSPNRSYLNASGAGGNVSNTLDVTSPKWSKASEKLHHSPSHFSDAKIRSGHCDASMNITSGMRVLPMRMNACTELLWPASDRRAFTSMQHEAYPQALYAMHKKNASGDQESGSPEDQPLRPTLNTVKRRFREPKITTLQFQNSDQSENTQPFDGPCKSNVNRWSGWNLKMRGSEALSRSVDASFSRGRQKDSMATPMMVESKAIFGSSRTPRSMSLSRAGSFPKLKGQGCARGFQKEKTEVKRENGFPHEISITSKDGQTNANVNESQALSREMEAAMSSTFSDIFTTESLESAINSPLNIIADSVCNDATVENMEVTHVRGTKVPARFWKDAMNCSARGVQKGNVHSSLLDTELTLASSRRIAVRSCRPMSPGTYSECSMSSTDAPSPPWMTLVIPQQPSSLPKTSIFSRSTPSPGRSRAPLPSMLMQGQRSSNAAVSLNFGSDILKRGRKALMQIDAVPLFRILHNRLLQWRFINAKAEAGIEAQLLEAQKSLYNVFAKTCELRTSINAKRLQLEKGRQDEKLNALIQAQSPALEMWSSLEQKHSVALNGTIQALEAAVLQLPIVGAVKADTFEVKEAFDSALCVMNSGNNSVNYLTPKAAEVCLLMSELASVVSEERNLIEECANLIVMASTLQMEECSLRAHILQVDRESDYFGRRKAVCSAFC